MAALRLSIWRRSKIWMGCAWRAAKTEATSCKCVSCIARWRRYLRKRRAAASWSPICERILPRSKMFSYRLPGGISAMSEGTVVAQQMRPAAERRPFVDHAIVQLTLVRFREFWREPEAVFWVFIFPILLTTGLGIAFRNRPADVGKV